MPDDTTPEQLRIAHRRGHDTLMHERAREDVARANVLVTDNGAVLEVGELFDGEMLVVDGDQIISEPIPGGGGGGGTVDVGPGLDGDGSAPDPITIVRGTGVNQTRHGNDAAYSDARTPLAHTHAAADVVSGTFTAARVTSAGDGDLVKNVSGTLVGVRHNYTVYNLDFVDSNISTTPAPVWSVVIPAAGTYAIDIRYRIRTPATGGSRTFTMEWSCANMTALLAEYSAVHFAGLGRSEKYINAFAPLTLGSLTANTNATYDWFMEITVSAPTTLVLTASVNTDSGVLSYGIARGIKTL